MEALGRAIKEERERQGLSQPELARKAEISQATMSRIEANRQEPTIEILAGIARALDISLTELLERAGLAQPPLQLLDGVRPPAELARLARIWDRLPIRERATLLRIAETLAAEYAEDAPAEAKPGEVQAP